jgi:hypothetical protein
MSNLKPCLYERFLAEREEIIKHKGIESEKQGYSVTFEKALTSWIKLYRKEWLNEYNRIRTNTPDNLRN